MNNEYNALYNYYSVSRHGLQYVEHTSDRIWNKTNHVNRK